VSPHADQEVHGNQRDFPEDIEQEQIHGHKHAYQAEFEQQQQYVELFHTLVDVMPTDQHGDRREQRGQDHKPEAETVHGDVVADGGRGDPENVGHELRVRGIRHDGVDEAERSQEDKQRDGQRSGTDRLRAILRNEQQGEGTEDGQRQHNAERVHRAPPQEPTTSRINSAPNTTHTA